MQTFYPGYNTTTILASNVLGQLSTKQYGVGSVTNDILAGGISIDKLAAFGKAGQLIQSTGGGEMAITPPQIFSNIDESGLVNSGIVYGDSINGYSVVPINPMIALYITSQRIAPIITATLATGYSFTQAHGLAASPFMFRVVLVCNALAGDQGYNTGVEINLDDTGSEGITVGYDSTNVYAYVSTSAVIKIVNMTSGHPAGSVTLTLANWYIKFYLSL